MALNFPDNPTTGSTHTAAGKNYLYDSDTTAWSIADAGFIAATDVAPTDVSSGTLWFNSTDASLYMYYDDGTSKQWIAVSGPSGADGADGADGSGNLAAVAGDILPDADSSRSLGSPTKKWKALHLSANTLFLGDSGSISAGPGGSISMPSLKIGSGAGAVELTASADGKLETKGTKADGTKDSAPAPAGAGAIAYANAAAFPSSGNTTGAIAFDLAAKFGYIWDGAEWDKFSGKDPATLSSATPISYNGETGQSITVNGTGFVSGDVIDFITADTTTVHRASSTTLSNSSTIVAVTPQAFTVANGPLTIRHTSGSVTVDLTSAVSTGASPIWTTPAGTLGSFNKDATLALTVVATDSDAGQAITYADVSGNYPPGVTLNGSTGSISGAVTTASVSAETTYSKTIKASDTIGNFVNRIFDITILNALSILYEFDTAVFGHGGLRGAYGPSLSAAIGALSVSTYSDSWKNDTTLFNVTSGIQRWTVPFDGTYRITADGADARLSDGGYGASMRGDFVLTLNDYLYMIVGQKPKTATVNEHSGAGGTFVVKETGSSSVVGDILVIAGGAGGAHNQGSFLSISNASGSTSGFSGNGGGAGGTGGNGGGATTGGAGGGGFLTAGGAVSGSDNGSSWKQGGAGGIANSTYEGGFGGGGAHGNTHGGGGGGYSGGGGSMTSPYAGGGGGSYNADVSSGNQVNQSGAVATMTTPKITIQAL